MSSAPRPTPASALDGPLLEVEGLKTYFPGRHGPTRAVDGVSFTVRKGEAFGLVGESGCGKTMTARSILRLVPPPGKIMAGEIRFAGSSLLRLTNSGMRRIRGNRISMIFQEPQASLNPVFNIGSQVAEVLRVHKRLSQRRAWARALDLLKSVGLPDHTRRAKAYPHEISGGQAQRVMIAIAMALNPELLIADEPTTALDVTIQAQILGLLNGLRRAHNTAILLITHDLGVVAGMCDQVAVMYAGQIVEQREVGSLFRDPLHPYTRGLLESIPLLGQVRERLRSIPGTVPDLRRLPTGCRFAPRCEARSRLSSNICLEEEPGLLDIGSGGRVRCWLYEDSSAATGDALAGRTASTPEEARLGG